MVPDGAYPPKYCTSTSSLNGFDDPDPPPISGELASISVQPIVSPLKYSKCAVSVLNLNDPGLAILWSSCSVPCGGTKKCLPEYVVIPDVVESPPVLFSFDRLLTLTSDIYC